MSSIVIDLQDEILSSDCDIVQILRRAHVIAVKLGLKEFDQWISYELNGYPDQNTCPDYRKIRGTLKAFNPYHGWIPAVITDGELETVICEKKISNSISEIITLCRLVYEFPGDQVEHLDRLFGSPLPMRYALRISVASAMDIIEKVKNTILEWTLKLEEEGVLGEGMRFSDKEKQSAMALPQTVNNYYGATNVINAPSKGMQIGNADGNQRQNSTRKEAGCDKGSACWAEGLFDKCRKQLGGRTDPDKHTRFVLKRKRPHGISPHAVIFLQSLLLLYHVYWLPM